MEDKKGLKLALLAVVIVAAIGFLAMQFFGPGAAATNPPVVEYANQPPSDSSRYRGEGGAPPRENTEDRM